ncbi:DUF4142 domain-containing protein [Dyella sp.]|uniref:DUF4142 domain-containing protein n=1 Tax=Dyella sp. TaxID=1869338 RepID=UPI002ED6A2FC
MPRPYPIRLALLLALTINLPLLATSSARAQVNHATDMASRGLGTKDRQFLQAAANNGAAEVVMAQMALQQAKSQQIRQFAQQLLDDHMQINRELVKLTNLKQDAQPAKVPAQDSEMQKKLHALHGSDFDQAYVADMVQAHQNSVIVFTRATQESSDPDVKHFATTTLPLLQHHLELAKGLQAR